MQQQQNHFQGCRRKTNANLRSLGNLGAIRVICISYTLYPQHNETPRESIWRVSGDGFQVVWGEGLARDRGEGPVSTKVTWRWGRVRRPNCKLDHGSYERNNRDRYKQREDKA